MSCVDFLCFIDLVCVRLFWVIGWCCLLLLSGGLVAGLVCVVDLLLYFAVVLFFDAFVVLWGFDVAVDF